MRYRRPKLEPKVPIKPSSKWTPTSMSTMVKLFKSSQLLKCWNYNITKTFTCTKSCPHQIFLSTKDILSHLIYDPFSHSYGSNVHLIVSLDDVSNELNCLLFIDVQQGQVDGSWKPRLNWHFLDYWLKTKYQVLTKFQMGLDSNTFSFTHTKLFLTLLTL